MGAVLASTDLERFLMSLGGSLAYTYTEAAGIANTTIADIESAVAAGELESTTTDSTRTIPAAELRRWLDALAFTV